MFSSLLGMGRLFSERTTQPTNISNNTVRSRRVVNDVSGGQVTIEEVYSNGSLIQRSATTTHRRPPQMRVAEIEIFVMNSPAMNTFIFPSNHNNLDLNFRSLFNNESILEHIMRLSEQQRGRTGTPPASQQSIDSLEQIDITDEHCKITD